MWFLKVLNSYAVSTAIVYFLIYGVPLLGKVLPCISIWTGACQSLYVYEWFSKSPCHRVFGRPLYQISVKTSHKDHSIVSHTIFFFGLYIIVTLYGFFVLSVLILNFYERLVMWCYWTTNIQCRLVYIITWFYDRLS